MFAAVSSTPQPIRSTGARELREGDAEDDDRRTSAADDPFAFELVGEARGEQRRDRIGEGDDEGIFQALGDGDALLDQQRRHPIGKAVEAEGLAEIEHHEHHDQRKIGRLEQVAETDHRRCGRSAALGYGFRFPARAGRSLERAHDGHCLRAAAMARQPERALRQVQPQDPDHHARGGADQDHPAPAVEAHGRQRHQPPGEEGHDRHRDEHHGLVDRERAAAHPARHELGDIGVDGDDLDADADPGKEAPQQHAAGGGLERHDHRRRAIGEQRPGEDRAAAEPVGEEAEEERSDEQSGKRRRNERADAGEAEERVAWWRSKLAAGQPRRDIAGQEQVVDLETAAKRQQDHEPPEITRRPAGFRAAARFRSGRRTRPRNRFRRRC